MKPTRYSATRRFHDLKRGDFAYSIHSHGNRVYALIEQVTTVGSDTFSTLACYSDGTPLTYFGLMFRRRTGVELCNYAGVKPTDRPKVRLYLELPEGIPLLPAPKREAVAA